MAGIFAIATRTRRPELPELAANLADKMVLYPWQHPHVVVHEDSGVALGAVVHENGCLAEGGYCRQEEQLTCVVEGYLIRSLEDCGADAAIRAGRYAEAALAAYRKFGGDFARRLEGAFNVILHDARTGELIVGSGRFCPSLVYRYHQDGELAYCTQAGPLAACGFFPGRADPEIVCRMLSDGALSGNYTFVQGVETLEVPTIERTELATGQRRGDVYWTCGDIGKHDTGKSFDQHLGELCEVLDAAGARITSRPGRYVSGLSGGLDSRLVTGVAARHAPDLKAWTFGSEGAPDIEIAAAICRELGIEHLVYPTRPELVPQYAAEYAATLEGCVSTEFAYGLERTRGLMDHADIVLNGFAGELILGAYYLKLNLKLLAWLLKTRRRPGGSVPHPVFTRNRSVDSIAGYLAFKEGPPTCLAPYLAHAPTPIFDRLREQVAGYARSMPIEFVCEHHTLYNHGHRWTLMGIISDRHFYSDGSLFYDYEVLEKCFAIPPAYRQDNRMYAEVFRKMMPAVGALPNSNNGLPADVGPRRAMLGKLTRAVRQKIAPERASNRATGNNPNDWSRTIYPDFYRELLADPRTQARPFWDAAGLMGLCEDHFAGRVRAATPLGQLAAVEFFCRRWLD